MDEWGFPRLDTLSGFKVIQKDFEEAYREGKIRFEEDGIYLDYEGKSYKGYMFIKEYHISRYHAFPRFHVVKCKTIDDFIASGRFRQRYVWSNSATNDVMDVDTNTEYQDSVLKLCRNCRELLVEKYLDTEDFNEQLREEASLDEEIEIDIFGYERHWQQISRSYKRKMNFTCEECGIQINNNFDQRFLHVHHMDGDKLNNKDSNLKCLCVLCHSYANRGHEYNFQVKRMMAILQAFVAGYKNELKRTDNRYLRKFENSYLNG